MIMNALPYEILDNILKYIVYDDDDFADPIRTLASISRTSRRLHQIVEPALYSSFEEFNKRTLTQYLSTILDCPHLAAHVKTYHGSHKPWTFSKYSANVAFSALKSKHPRLLEIIREKTTCPARDEIFFDKMEDGSWDTTTSLTLVHLPNLQHLHLTIVGFKKWYGSADQADHESDNYYELGRTLMDAIHEHLTTLTIHPSRENCRDLDIGRLLALVRYLKPLKKLSLRGWDLEFWGLQAKMSIVELELLDSTMTFSLFERHLFELFELFPALEKLRYGHSKARDDSRHRLMTMTLAHALIQLKPPLRELYIENGISDDRLLHEGNMAMVKSFSEFEALEVIDILAFDQWISISGNTDTWKSSIRPLAELLPSKIKRLVLRKASTWTVEQVVVFLQQKDSFPKLQALTIEFAEHVRLKEIEGELSVLREAGVRCGIDLSVQGGTFVGPDNADIFFGPNSDSLR